MSDTPRSPRPSTGRPRMCRGCCRAHRYRAGTRTLSTPHCSDWRRWSATEQGTEQGWGVRSVRTIRTPHHLFRVVSARVGAQAIRALAVTQFRHHFALDLPDAFPRKIEFFADLVQGAW